MTLRNWMGLAGALVLSLGIPGSVEGQSQRNRALASREELQALLIPSKGTKLSGDDRRRIEKRLAEGDFQQGDKLLMRVRGDTALSDTFVVRTGQMLVLPNIPPVELKGVLRSEVQPKLLAIVAQYIRSPEVDVDPLIRLGLLGSVGRPGYYNVRADVPLSEVMTEASGLNGDADIRKMTANRGAAELYDKETIRQAMADGMSLDQLGLQGGDEIVVGKRGSGFSGSLPVIVAVTGIVASLIAVISLF